MDERPRQRTDLVIRSTEEAGQTVYIIKDPVTGRFFRLRPPEFDLLQRADGDTDCEDAARRTSERFGLSLTGTAVSAFYARMAQLGLLESAEFERERIRRSRHSIQQSRGLRRLVSWRLATFNPDRTITRWAARVRFLFNGYAALAAALVVAWGVAVLYTNRADLVLSLGQVWQLASIPMLLGSLFVIAFFHEYAHAVTLKHYGGSVSEMGFLLLYGQPSFYCNLSDAYLLDSKRQKLLVDGAGLIAQAVVTAIAILLWRVLEPGSLPGHFCFFVAAGSIAIYAFNFNPLIRLDGYYLLSDLLGIANLRPRAFAYLRAKWREWATGRPPTGAVSRRLRRLYVGYGVLALTYTVGLIGFIGYWVSRFLYLRSGLAGPVAFYLAVLAWGLLPRTLFRSKSQSAIKPTGEDTTGDAADARDNTSRRSRKPLVFWGVVALLIALSFLIRGERRVGSACRIEASELFRITEPEPGSVATEMFIGGEREQRHQGVLKVTSTELASVDYDPTVMTGDTVGTGDTLLLISSNRHRLTLAVARAQLAAVKAERNLLISGPKAEQVKQREAELEQIEAERSNKRAEWERARRMYERGLISGEQFEAAATEYEVVTKKRDAKKSEISLLLSGPKAEELLIKDAKLEELSATVSYLEQQIDASTILSPIRGVVATPTVDHERVLLEVVQTSPVRAVLAVTEDDVADVAVGQPVNLKVKSMPTRTFGGRVARISGMATADEDIANGRPIFAVTVTIANADGTLRPGMTGHAKISCGRRTFASLVTRSLRSLIRVEIWSLF